MNDAYRPIIKAEESNNIWAESEIKLNEFDKIP